MQNDLLLNMLIYLTRPVGWGEPANPNIKYWHQPGRMCRPKEAHQSEKWCNALRLLHPTRDGAMITAAQAIIPTGLPDDNETTFI